MGRNGRSDDSGPLDFTQGVDERREWLVASIVEAAEPELLRRREQLNVTAVMVAWARPTLSAAATVVLLVSAAVALVGRTAETAVASPPIESAIVPEEMAAWLVAGYQPTVTEFVVALEEVRR